MNRIKIVLLTAVAVTAFMAAVGASAASATPTTLCKVEETHEGIPFCEPFNQYPAGTPIHAILEPNTKLVVETPMGKVECEESTFRATTEQQTEMPLGAVVNVWTFGKCGKDAVTTVLLGTLDIEVIDWPVWTHNGTLTFTGTQIVVKKGEAECLYAVGHSGVLTGGAMATVDLEGTLTRIGGNAKCPAGNASWKGAYTVIQPEPLWVGL
ncbi:MAG: hypothetical protein ACTHKT_05625 [Solirubrobacterales bacterium]